MPVLVVIALLALAPALAGCAGPEALPLPGVDHPANPQAEAAPALDETQSWYRMQTGPTPVPPPAQPKGGHHSGGHGHGS